MPGTVEVIDAKTSKVIRTISLGYRSFPEHVTPSWDLRWLYVDTSHADELARIHPRTGKLVKVIHGIEHPYNLYFSPDGSVAIDAPSTTSGSTSSIRTRGSSARACRCPAAVPTTWISPPTGPT